MPLTVRQTEQLLERVKDIHRQCRRMDRSLDVLVKYATHDELGPDVRAFLEQFTTPQGWTQFRTTVAGMMNQLEAPIAAYEGGALPSETDLG